mgnify:FL=1
MKKKINVLVRVIVMIMVFVITIYFVNIFENRNYKNLAKEMNDAELPLAYVSYGDTLLNCMHGYTSDVDITLLRDSITPIDEQKHIEILVQNDKKYASGYSYEIRSIAGDSLVEKGDIEAADNGSGYDELDINVRMDLKKDMEYMLVVKASSEKGLAASYYTRIVVNDDYHEAELLKAVQDFHDASFDFNALETESVIGTYKTEYAGASTGDSFGLGHVNLANDYADIMWDGLKPTVVSDINIYIKEIDVNYAVIEMEYNASSITDQDVTSYYAVKEFYKAGYSLVEVSDSEADGEDSYGDASYGDASYGDASYGDASYGDASYDEEYSYTDEESQGGQAEETSHTEPKITMFSYDRYVDEYFDRTGIDALNNVYEIGIVSSDDLEYRYVENNRKIAFVRNGQLWMYDYDQGEIIRVYSFCADDYTEDAATYDAHNINIMEFADDGNLTFSVYGYMNRGDHEGKLGIGLFTFDYSTLEVDELLFVECNVPYEAMKTETSRLTYYDGQKFYYMMGGKVNAVDIKNRKQSYIAENLSAGDVKVSADMSVMAFGENEDQSQNTRITLMNMKTGNSYDITAGDGECLICYGFKDSDMVYGVSDIADAGVDADLESFSETKYSEESRDNIPAKRLYIVGSDGSQIKEYAKDGCYLMQVDVNANLLYLTRGEKSNGKFVAIKDDFITFKEDDSKQTIGTVHNSSITGYDRLYFTVPENIYLSYIPNLNITKEKIDDQNSYMIMTIEREKVTYHVYDNLGLSKIYDVAGDAINYAESVAGIVVSSDGEVIYRKMESQEYNTIAAGIFHHSTGTVDASLTDCLYMVLNYQGVQVTEDEIKQYSDPVTVLNTLGKKKGINVTGLSLDMLLGYVSDGIPVISRIDDGRYVLIVSYNDEDVRYYDPVENKEIVVSREEYIDMMVVCQNESYTYVSE